MSWHYGLQSKNWSGIDGYPLDCYDFKKTCGAKSSSGKSITPRENGEGDGWLDWLCSFGQMHLRNIKKAPLK